MSETFKEGRGPKFNSRYKNKYDDIDFPIVVAIIVIIALAFFFAPKKNVADQPQQAQATKRKTGAKRRLRPQEPFSSIHGVQEAIRKEGLESCNLILAIDFTKSNQWNGTKTFGGKCLHDVSGKVENPYQRVMGVVARTLEPFDEDHMIPTFGFGDVETKASKCFPFYPDRHCVGLDEVLQRYNEIVPGIQMSGPTSFAPCIRKAIQVVKENDRSFHVLVIIADGQVDRRDETIRAIVEASAHPLAIICIGVGDGPWDDMIEFDDDIPERQFDNFQFVDFHAIDRCEGFGSEFKVQSSGSGAGDASCSGLSQLSSSRGSSSESMESGDPVDPQFAMCALMELPAQYKALKEKKMI